MDYIDQLKQFGAKAAQLVKVIGTEEATKNSLILPFFQMLGYDIFNPLEFVPEYTADVGIKKGEKVDFAIVIDGKPTIFIEAKSCNTKLEAHDSQLFRYFATCSAKLAILTNGIIYRFYTDIDEKNKMDLTPFMEFNLLDIKDTLVPEIKRFHRNSLDVESIFGAASDLKYTTAIKELLAKQATDPDDGFLNFIVKEIYPGRKSAIVMDKFKDIFKKSFSQYVNDLMNEKFKSLMAKDDAPAPVEPIPAVEELPSVINTTADELECLIIIKSLLHEVIPPARLTYKDTQNYFNVLLDGKVTRWICRLQLDGDKKWLIIPDAEKNQTKHEMACNDDLYQFKKELQESAARVISK